MLIDGETASDARLKADGDSVIISPMVKGPVTKRFLSHGGVERVVAFASRMRLDSNGERVVTGHPDGVIRFGSSGGAQGEGSFGRVAAAAPPTRSGSRGFIM